MTADIRALNLDARATSLRSTLRVFEEWLADPTVNEIIVNRLGEVVLWKGGRMVHTPCAQITYSFLDKLGVQLSSYSSVEFDEATPEMSAYLPNGERVEMTRPPACPAGVMYVNIRKHTSKSFLLKDFVDQGYFANTRHVMSHALTPEERAHNAAFLTEDQLKLWELAQSGDWVAFLNGAVWFEQNIVVSGATGTGKTSFIRSLVNEFIPADQRLITVEDTPEMPLPNHPNSQHLFYKKDGAATGMTAKEALRATMRKTPKRVLLAELRDDAAFFYVQNVLNSGHPGGLTTVHANTPRDAFVRLGLLVKASPEGMTMPYEEILRLLHQLVHVVVQLRLDSFGRRHVSEIYFDPMYSISLVH